MVSMTPINRRSAGVRGTDFLRMSVPTHVLHARRWAGSPCALWVHWSANKFTKRGPLSLRQAAEPQTRHGPASFELLERNGDLGRRERHKVHPARGGAGRIHEEPLCLNISRSEQVLVEPDNPLLPPKISEASRLDLGAMLRINVVGIRSLAAQPVHQARMLAVLGTLPSASHNWRIMRRFVGRSGSQVKRCRRSRMSSHSRLRAGRVLRVARAMASTPS